MYWITSIDRKMLKQRKLVWNLSFSVSKDHSFSDTSGQTTKCDVAQSDRRTDINTITLMITD